mgnify:CR=1 FL=1
MAQNLDAFIPELWSRRIQYLTKNALVATQICSFEEQPDLKYGDRIHRPYPNDLVVNDYVKYTDTTQQDLIGTDEYLDIDQSKEISFAIDEVDWIQNKYDLENSYVERAAYRLANDIDGSVLGEVVNANVTCDGSDIGSSGAISLSTSNCLNAVMTAGAKLTANGCEMDKTWALVVSPKMASVIAQTVAQDWFSLADLALKNGYAGNFAGYKVYSSNNVEHTRTISFSSVVATDEITVAGVKFTFVASIGSTAGNVLKGANDAAALTNLAAAINGAAGAGTTYVEVSAADRAKLKNVRDNLDAYRGVLTNARDVLVSTDDKTITVGAEECHALLCRPGAIDLVMQQNIDVRKNPLPKQKADYYIISCLYGVKTFQEGKERMVKIMMIL